MKIRFLSYLGFIVSLGWIALSIWQWWFRYHDLSTFALAVGAGFGGIIFSYGYSWFRNMEKKLDTVSKRIDSLVLWDSKMGLDE